jgi:predicted nucleic acid-binding protein
MVIDASVWVSGFVPQDAHHVVTRAWLSQRLAGGDNLVIPSLALAEVSGAISRRTGVAALGHQSAEQVLNAPGLRVVALDAGLGAEAAKVAANLRLRGTDAVYVVVAHSMGIPLVTWDQELQVRSSSYIEVLEPGARSRPSQ